MNPNGSIKQYKARLVIEGYEQRTVVDYNQTYRSLAKLNNIISIISIATSENINLIQFDVSTAFFYGKLDEIIYMKQPEDFMNDTNKVGKLKRSLYG